MSAYYATSRWGHWFKRLKARNYSVDPILAMCVGGLLIFGVVMVFSASIALGVNHHLSFGRYHYLTRDIIFNVVGLLGMYFVFFVPIRFWETHANKIMVLAIVLLVLVRIPHIGHIVNGSYRWFAIGPIHVQPSELAKLATVFFGSAYMVRKAKEIQNFRYGLAPFLLIMVLAMGCVLIEPDLGSTAVMAAIALNIAFHGRVKMSHFIIIVIVCAAAGGFFIWSKPYRYARFTAFMSETLSPECIKTFCYQLYQSKLAIGRGGIWGVGLGEGISKLYYLPEPHTDFIASVISEELGLFGIAVLVGVYMLIVSRMVAISRRAFALRAYFSSYVVAGAWMWICGQAIFNVAVVIGAAPTKGITLPFISYGGSSLVSVMVMMGIVFRIDYENRIVAGDRPRL